MESKLLSSTGFTHELGVEELYVLTTHWLSDISFFEQEISYFQSLITRYFLPNLSEENMLLIKSLENHFQVLSGRKEQIQTSILAHQQELSALMDKCHVENEEHFNVLLSQLEVKLFDFVKALRQVKLEFFNATKFTGKARRK